MSGTRGSWAPKCLPAQAFHHPSRSSVISRLMSCKSSRTRHLPLQFTLCAPAEILLFLLNSSLIHRLLWKEVINKRMFLDDIPLFKSNFRQQQYHVSKDNSPHAVRGGFRGDEVLYVMSHPLAPQVISKQHEGRARAYPGYVGVFAKPKTNRDFPGGPVVKTLPSNARSTGSIPGQGTRIPYALRPKNQNIK